MKEMIHSLFENGRFRKSRKPATCACAYPLKSRGALSVDSVFSAIGREMNYKLIDLNASNSSLCVVAVFWNLHVAGFSQ